MKKIEFKWSRKNIIIVSAVAAAVIIIMNMLRKKH